MFVIVSPFPLCAMRIIQRPNAPNLRHNSTSRIFASFIAWNRKCGWTLSQRWFRPLIWHGTVRKCVMQPKIKIVIMIHILLQGLFFRMRLNYTLLVIWILFASSHLVGNMDSVMFFALPFLHTPPLITFLLANLHSEEDNFQRRDLNLPAWFTSWAFGNGWFYSATAAVASRHWRGQTQMCQGVVHRLSTMTCLHANCSE